jgi:Sec-independent protein translocase protein TatA
MGGFHLLDLVVILVIGLLVAGPKALQSISRNAGKGVGQAKTVKDKVMAELPMEEVSELSKTFSKIPLSPQQAIQKLLIPEQEKKQQETKQEVKPESSSSTPTSVE